jgi:hypothetical protein
MTEVTRRTFVTPVQVFVVLADGWSCSSWVVGASRIRAVDDAWPARRVLVARRGRSRGIAVQHAAADVADVVQVGDD